MSVTQFYLQLSVEKFIKNEKGKYEKHYMVLKCDLLRDDIKEFLQKLPDHFEEGRTMLQVAIREEDDTYISFADGFAPSPTEEHYRDYKRLAEMGNYAEEMRKEVVLFARRRFEQLSKEDTLDSA